MWRAGIIRGARYINAALPIHCDSITGIKLPMSVTLEPLKR
jgi:hypothetical protein